MRYWLGITVAQGMNGRQPEELPDEELPELILILWTTGRQISRIGGARATVGIGVDGALRHSELSPSPSFA
jgi:hypothetical protein